MGHFWGIVSTAILRRQIFYRRESTCMKHSSRTAIQVGRNIVEYMIGVFHGYIYDVAITLKGRSGHSWAYKY